MSTKYITPEVFELAGIDAYDGVPVAKRVLGVLDTDNYQIVDEGDGWWIERWTHSTPPMPHYAVEYLKKIIKKKYNLEYLGEYIEEEE